MIVKNHNSTTQYNLFSETFTIFAIVEIVKNTILVFKIRQIFSKFWKKFSKISKNAETIKNEISGQRWNKNWIFRTENSRTKSDIISPGKS